MAPEKKKIEGGLSIREQANQLSYCKLNQIARVCDFRFVRGATLDAHHHYVLSCAVLWNITRIFQKPVGKVKTPFQQREAFSAILWSSSSDETAATAASTLVFEGLAQLLL